MQKVNNRIKGARITMDIELFKIVATIALSIVLIGFIIGTMIALFKEEKTIHHKQ